MENKSIIETFIAREKTWKASPFLTERIMSALPASAGKTAVVWIQTAAIAASIVIALWTGIQIGRIYDSPLPPPITWNIDDTQIENLVLYDKLHE